MRSLDIALVELYLLFHLNQKRCINGRRKRRTTKTQSLRTHWDSFRMLFKQEMLSGIDHQIEQDHVNNVSTPTPLPEPHLPSRRRLSTAGHHIISMLFLRLTPVQLIDALIGEYKLSSERRDNRPMTLENLRLQIETTLNTTELAFHLGEQRILAVLFLLLLAPAGSRPDSILKVQYKHIEIVLHQPDKGPPKLLIYMKLEYTKTRDGPKDL